MVTVNSHGAEAIGRADPRRNIENAGVWKGEDLLREPGVFGYGYMDIHI